MRIPTLLHEQNAVLGRVNRLLAGDATAIATAYAQVDRIEGANMRAKTVLVGNPVREEIAGSAKRRSRRSTNMRRCKILVTGGSQGATILSEVVPAGLGLLRRRSGGACRSFSNAVRTTSSDVRKRYAELGIPAELMTYIEDMPEMLGDAHLVIGRAGASTIAELTAAGRPAILIPFPSATDDHQTANAREMTEGRWRAHDPAGKLHARSAGAADRGDGRRSGRAQQCRVPRAVGRTAARRARPRRPGRASR